jgi:DNA polymerase III delta prime subunit
VFENIIGQATVVRNLVDGLKNDTIPGSLLFDGPSLSAKLTTGLELARVSSCNQGANWNCPCAECARHRILVHQDILLLGPKISRMELELGADMLERSPGVPSRYFFIRAARKLTRRFDQELYENEESRLSKALPLLRTVFEALDACLPGGADDEGAAKEARKILPACAKLESLLPDATPVFQIRSMEFWARLAPFGKKKTIIMEHADRMLDASRNALLKILEEPPIHTRFILTSSRRQAIIPTILSRVRNYRFSSRSGDEARTIIERVFRCPEDGAANLETFFGKRQSEGVHDMTIQGRAWVASLLAVLDRSGRRLGEHPLAALAAAGSHDPAEIIASAAAETGKFGSSDDTMAWSFPAFLDAGSKTFADLLRDGQSGTETLRLAESYADLARDALLRYSSYNLNPVALAERLADSFIGGNI